jgi:uncharacterized protein (DUF433 family)
MASTAMGKRTTTKKKTEVVKKYLCPYCNKEKVPDDFYMSSDPLVMTGRTVMCKDCARKIARNYDPLTKEYGECTKESVMSALERLDKPFLDVIWDASYFELHDTGSAVKRNSIWETYIKNISMQQYNTLRWRDGDIYSTFRERAIKQAKTDIIVEEKQHNTQDQEILNEYEINRKDVIRMIGYDPFANYPLEEDKPVLYAQLVSFIDDETKNDGMKMNAVIQIVQSFNQIQKINDAINELTYDVQKLNSNNGTVKQLAATTAQLLKGANDLAKDNGINTIVPVPGNWFEKSPLNCWKPLRAKLTTKWLEMAGLNV